MNQTCKVCGEPAAGFHFGAFTCEGCKSFFGRSYNNLSSITECKNGSQCVINKKNRTACKACRLRKCLTVGMSKSGSRYGRRSNWFKIHCLLQEQQHQQSGNAIHHHNNSLKSQKTPLPNLGILGQPFAHPMIQQINKTKEEWMLLVDDYKNTASPAVSSPDSHNSSDSSVEANDARRMSFFPNLMPPTFLPPHNFIIPPGYPPLFPHLFQATNNNNRLVHNHNTGAEAFNKIVFLDAVLQSQRSPTPQVEPQPPIKPEAPSEEGEDEEQDDHPIDLSMKTMSERGSSPAQSELSDSAATERGAGSEGDEETDCDSEKELKRIEMFRASALDLTTKV